MAILPVKTLQSITVTPTALSDMLINATQAVSLKVVANYLTGAVASTEEVTTSATVTASAGTYASGVYTAGATAGAATLTVSYTEGGVTKTGTITVNVTDAPPVVTTVTVTLPSTIIEASSTAAVVLVKDQNGATMTTGFTTTYAMTTGTSTVSTTGLVTAGTYSSTASENAHILTVTVTPTTGTAVTATANFTVTADTTKPTIVSVSALDNKTIVVTYDKKVSSTATTITNYKLYHSTTGVTADMKTAVADQAKDIAASALFTDSTQKIVKITISAIGTSLQGYPASGLDAVNYRLYVSNVQDTTSSANTIVASSNTQFMGTTTPDSNKPVINAMAYNKGTGTLVITLDKAVTNALVYTNVKFNGTVLTAAVTNNSQTAGEENKISITVASADKTTIAALTGDLTVTILADAIADSNGNKNIETSKVASLTVPPTMTSAAYDESTNTLTLSFSQTLDLSTSTLRAFFTDNASFRMKSNEFSAVALDNTDTLLTTSNNATVQVLLSTTHANAFEAVSSHTSPKVLVAANAFKNTNGDSNLKQDDSTTDYPAVAMTVAKDSTKPVVQSITYNESTKRLVFTFNVPVSRTFTVTNVTFFTSKDDAQLTVGNGYTSSGDLTGCSALEVTDSTTLTFDLTSTTNANIVKIAADLKTVQQGKTDADTPASYDTYFKIAVDTFTKSGSLLKNAAVTAKAAATTVTFTDNAAPYIDKTYNTNTGIKVTNQVTLDFMFNEKVNITDAANAANFKIWLMNGQTKQSALTVHTATLIDNATTSSINPKFGKKTVQLITAAQTSGATYLLEVVGLKDLAGNIISTTDTNLYSVTFSGHADPAPSPTVVGAKIKDNGNQSLDTSDYIAVTFDRPVKLNTSAASTQVIGNAAGSNVSNFVLSTNFPADYSKTNNLMMSTDAADADKVVWIKVDTTMVSTLTVGSATVNYIGTGSGTQTLVQDKYSNAYAKAAGAPVTVESPLGATTISEALLTDVDNSGTVNAGDTLKVTFSNPLYVVTGSMATTNVITESGGTFGTGATIATTMTTSVASNTLTITMGTSPTITPAQILAVEDINITDQFLKDSWAIKVASSVKKAITTATTAAPYITKAEWVDSNGDGAGNSGDYIYVTYNVPVWLDYDAAAGNKANQRVMWFAGGVAMTNTDPLVTKVANDPKQLRIEIKGNQTIVPTVTTFEMDVAGTVIEDYITNFAGVKAVTAVTAGATTVKITAPSDATQPTVTSATFIGSDLLKVVFSKSVNISKFVAGDDNTATGMSINNSTSLELTAPVFDAADSTQKTVIFTIEAAVTIPQQKSGITGSTTAGLQIGTTSGISDLYGNTLASNTGMAYISIVGDTLAPKKFTATETAKLSHNNTLGNVITSSLDFAVANAVDGNGNITTDVKEESLLEVYIGSSSPTADTVATGSTAAYAKTSNTATAISGLTAATASQVVFYRLVDKAGNKSEWVQDGIVPAAPDATKLAYSLPATQTTVTAGAVTGDTATTCSLSCFFADNADGTGSPTAQGAKTGVDLTTYAGALQAAQTIAAGKYVFYQFTNSAGNVSATTADGAVPAAPTATEFAVRYDTTGTAGYKLKNMKGAALGLTANDTFTLYINSAVTTATLAGNAADAAVSTNNVNAQYVAANAGQAIHVYVTTANGNVNRVADGSVSVVSTATVTNVTADDMITGGVAEKLAVGATTNVGTSTLVLADITTVKDTTGTPTTVALHANTVLAVAANKLEIQAAAGGENSGVFDANSAVNITTAAAQANKLLTTDQHTVLPATGNGVAFDGTLF